MTNVRPGGLFKVEKADHGISISNTRINADNL